MIKILSVNPTGLFAWGIAPTFMFDKRGLVFIKGLNGSGKSSILNSIKEILFAKNDTGKSGNYVINDHKDWNNGYCGILQLIDAQSTYWRVITCRKWVGALPDEYYTKQPSAVIRQGGTYEGTDVFLERWDGTEWADERATSIGNKVFKDTQDKIKQQVIKMTYEQFSAYVCLGQEANSALVNGTSSDREDIIQSIVDVKILEDASDVANAQALTFEQQRAVQQSYVDGMQRSLELTFKNLPKQEDFEYIQAEIAQLGASKGMCEVQIEQQSKVVAEYEIKLVEAKKLIDGSDDKLDLYAAETNHAHERFKNRLENTVQNTSILDDLQAKLAVSDSEFKRISLKLQNFGSNVNDLRCMECGEPTNHHNLSKYHTELTDALDYHMKVINECTPAVENEKIRLRDEARTIRAWATDIYQKEIQDIDVQRNKIMDDRLSVQNLERLKSNAQIELTRLRSEFNGFDNRIAAVQQRYDNLNKQINDYNNNLQVLVAEKLKLENFDLQIKHWRWVERNLKKMRLDEYTSSINRLNTLFADRLHEYFGSWLTAKLVTEQDKLKGKGTKKGIELLVSTSNKKDVPVEMYSGGQRKLIILAMFRASRALANERGIGVNLAAIDELDKDLDDVNVDRLIEGFESVNREAETCLVVSHNHRLANTMKFDETWEITLQNEISNFKRVA